MKISIKLDSKTYEGDVQEVITPTPTPIPPTTKKYSMVNCINWGITALQNLPPADEHTYFVLLVNADGSLKTQNKAQEIKFITDVKAKISKPTISVAGGTQNIADITKAVNDKTGFINAIADRMTWGYAGVTLDIENTNIAPQAMVDFILALRAKLGATAIIGVYTQPYQLNTVWAKLQDVVDSINWCAVMCYDFPNTLDEFKSITLSWLPKVKGIKNKLLAGAAVSYDSTGLDITEFGKILDWVNEQNLGGIGIWNDQLYIKSYQDILITKFV